MKEIFIKYNPYKLETTVTIDGQAVKSNSSLNVGEKRLQEWIESLPEILRDECNSMDFLVKFHGTMPDYEDIMSVAVSAKKIGVNIKTEHIPAKEVADKENAIAEVFELIQEGPFEELKTKDIQTAFKNARNSEFPVNVVATMSAGKSTLINALLGQKLMPASQEACTATITEIKDKDKLDFSATAYDKDGNLIESHPELTLKIMSSLNRNVDISKIVAEGNIPFINSDDMSLVLVDTPGPNNSRDPEHRVATYRMLDESSKTLVLYILNATQLGVNDDSTLLSHVADSMKVGGKQSKDRFIFVVNKLDDFNKDDDNVEESIKKVKSYLEDKGIENPNVFPASALTALNIRTVLKDVDINNINLDDADDDIYDTVGKIRKFNRQEQMHFEKYSPLTPSVRGIINTKLDEAVHNSDLKTQALIHSGIIPIEEAIKMYVLKYAKTAKVKNVVDTFAKRLESAKAFENTKQEIAEKQEHRDAILAQIDTINQKLTNGEQAKAFKAKIDKIDYTKEIEKISKDIVNDAQKEVSSQIENCSGKKLTRVDAESLCTTFAVFSDNLQTKVQVKLENVITQQLKKSADDLLNQYKAKLADLASEVTIDTITLSPFELMDGALSALPTDSLISNSIKTEKILVDRVWKKNENRKWYKFWTWGQEKGHWEDIYENKEYIDGSILAQKFFAPIQKTLIDNKGSAIDYAKDQSVKIKAKFNQQFEILDSLLQKKLAELELCVNDQRNAEEVIKETQNRLLWLENIQTKINAILEI